MDWLSALAEASVAVVAIVAIVAIVYYTKRGGPNA